MKMEVDGKVYCDWRISINGCEGSEFFRVVYYLANVLSWLSLIFMAISLVLRFYPHRRSWGSFFKGENIVSLVVFSVSVAFSIYFLSVIVEMPDLASGVLWTFPYPLSNCIMAYQISNLSRALPDVILQNHKNKWSVSGRGGAMILVSLGISFLVSHVILISVGFSLKQAGQVEQGFRWERSGLTITSISTFLFVVFSSQVCFSLRKKILLMLRDVRELNQGEIDTTLLALTATKLAQNIITGFVGGCTQITFFMLLAYYPNFFTDLSCSKALMFITVGFNSCILFTFTLGFVFFDLKKWLYDEQKRSSGKGSTKGSISKKDDVTLPALSLSAAGKEEVDQIIDDLKPK